MSPALVVGDFTEGSFPRVSGDEPGIQAVWTGIQTFSPREWG